jgi:predicted RNA-binding Zn-ribbon protein involved in translation (DUF1610 family)
MLTNKKMPSNERYQYPRASPEPEALRASVPPQGAGYLNLAIPALARKWNQQVGSAPLASFGNEEIIEMLRNLPKEALDSILSQLNKEPAVNNESESTEAHDLVCPQCGSIHVRKNGTVRHKQRYSCYDCHRSFGETTGSVRYKSKHTRET